MYEEIEKQFRPIVRNLLTTEVDWPYQDMVEAIRVLAATISATQTDEDVWSIVGEHDYGSLSDLIVGAYWHFYDWHAGQHSNSYAALCALGSIFQPGMTSGPESDSGEQDVYQALDDLARNSIEKKEASHA